MIGPADVGGLSAAVASPIRRTTVNKYLLGLRARDRLREMDVNQNVWAGQLYAELGRWSRMLMMGSRLREPSHRRLQPSRNRPRRPLLLLLLEGNSAEIQRRLLLR